MLLSASSFSLFSVVVSVLLPLPLSSFALSLDAAEGKQPRGREVFSTKILVDGPRSGGCRHRYSGSRLSARPISEVSIATASVAVAAFAVIPLQSN